MNNIPITQIVGWDNARPSPYLVESMREQGFLPEFPVLLARLNDDAYRVIDGRRRIAAAHQAGIKTVAAIDAENDPLLTIIAHATRSENPVAELEAYQALQRSGMSLQDIARAGYASLQRVRKVAQLTKLIPELADRLRSGEIAPSLAYKLAKLPPEIQREIAEEEMITGPVIKEYQQTRKAAATAALAAIFEQRVEPVSLDEFLAVLSRETLETILDEIPADDERFATWRGAVRRILDTKPETMMDTILVADF